MGALRENTGVGWISVKYVTVGADKNIARTVGGRARFELAVIVGVSGYKDVTTAVEYVWWTACWAGRELAVVVRVSAHGVPVRAGENVGSTAGVRTCFELAVIAGVSPYKDAIATIKKVIAATTLRASKHWKRRIQEADETGTQKR